jgi:hypothetical protein
MGGRLRERGDRDMKRWQRLGWVVLLVSILFLLENASARGEEPKGLFGNFHPYISVGEEYDSNIFLTHRDTIGDFITTVTGGLNFSTRDKNYGIDLNFQMGYLFYAEHHDLNFLSIGPSTFNAWYTLAPNLTFRIRDYITRSDAAREQLYSGNAQPDQFLLSTVRGQKAIYIRNVVEPSLDYQFGKENHFSVLYRDNIYRNENPRFEDSMENTINPKLTYWFDIHNGISLDYYLTQDTYQHSPDQLINAVTPRYTYRFDPRTSIFGEYHFEWQNFKSPGVDYYVHNPSLGIQYQFSPTLSGTAQVGYFWQIPVQGGKTQGPSFNLSLTKNTENTTYALSFAGGYTEDYITAQNLGFTKTYVVYGTINHKLTQRMSVGVTGSLARDEYSSDQKDWVWGIWGNASYLILKWLTGSLEVSYREDHSNIKINSYKDYRGGLRLTATF